MSARREIGFSTDLLGGAWTDSAQFRRVVPYDTYQAMRVAEIVGIGGSKRLLILANRLRDSGITPVQIHSRTGESGKEPWYDRVKIWGIEKFLPKPDVFEASFPTLDIVVHVPAVQRLLRVDRVRGYTAAVKAPRWLVENHDPGLGGVAEAIALSGRLSDRGVPSGTLVDVGHVTRRLQGKVFDRAWAAMTDYLGRMTDYPHARIMTLHIPIGTNMDDSLPDSLSDAHRKDLVASLGTSVQRIIFEYQRRGVFGLLHVFHREEQKERHRISTILDTWEKAGMPLR